MNETNKLEGVKMTQEKNLKNVKVIIRETASGKKERHYEDCSWLQFDANGNWLGLNCDCRDRMNAFSGWNISDLTYCYMEATPEFNDKRLMARSNKAGYVQFFCDEGCKESHFRTY